MFTEIFFRQIGMERTVSRVTVKLSHTLLSFHYQLRPFINCYITCQDEKKFSKFDALKEISVYKLTAKDNKL